MTADQPTAGVALKRAADILANPDRRMDAYYFGFDPTGVAEVDAILSAVASAGKAYHHTDCWSDGDATDVSQVDVIQATAQQAATAWNTRTPASGAVEADIDRLCTALLDGVGCTPWGHSSWDNDGTDGASRESVRQSIRRVLAALTSSPKAEGDVHERNLSASNAELLEQALAHPPLSAPQPLQGGEVTRFADALKVMRERALELTKKHGDPNGTDYEQGVNDHGHRWLTQINDLLALISLAQREGEG